MNGDREEFYVGYLPAPQGLSRLLVLVGAGLLLGGVILAAMLFLRQTPPDRIEGATVNLYGFVTNDPYPVLHIAGGDTERVTVDQLVLMRGGKRGVNDQTLARFDGKPVRMRGRLVKHQDVQMLRVANIRAPNAQELADLSAVDSWSTTEPEVLGVHTVVGKMTDPLCFLGGMRPGTGQSHKGCARLCLIGELPPTLVSWDSKGQNPVSVILTDTEGERLQTDMFGYVEDQAAYKGVVSKIGDVFFMKIGDVERI